MMSKTERAGSQIVEDARKLGSEFGHGRSRTDTPNESRPTIPEHIDNASFESAHELDQNGKWEDALNHYYSISHDSTRSIDDRTEAIFLMAQMHMNLAEYTQAENILQSEEVDEFIERQTDDKRAQFFRARQQEKLGWVHDYYGNVDQSIEHFTLAHELLEPLSREDDKYLRVFETANHFLGRQHAILAWRGEDTSRNSEKARAYFNKSIEIYENFEKKGKPDWAAHGFQYAWLTRLDLLEGNLNEASESLTQMKMLFTKHMDQYPDNGFLAYYYVLYGWKEYLSEEFENANKHFKEALTIASREGREYPPSQADAYMGMALVDKATGNDVEAQRNHETAIAINPNILKRSYV